MPPSAGWKLLFDWRMPKSLGQQQGWNERFNNFGMPKGEVLNITFAPVDESLSTLDDLGVKKNDR